MKTFNVSILCDGIVYGVDTGIQDKWNFKNNVNYYLADDYKNPSIVRFVDWNISQFANTIKIYVAVINNGKIEYYEPSKIYKSKSKAQDTYLLNECRRKNK